MPRDSATRATARTTPLAVAGSLLVVAGVVGYFVVVIRFGAWLPSVRNDAVPPWILVAFGVALAATAVARAPRGRRVLPAVLLGVDVVLAGWFALLLYVKFVVPPASGPVVGAPAPAFALADQTGKTVRLEDFRGVPLLLVFYRGHW